MRQFKIILCCLLLPALAPLMAAQLSRHQVRFPTVTAYNLQKTKVTLPAAFHGPLNLLLLTFHPGQTPAVDRWVTRARSLHHLHPTLDYYLLPISGRKNPLYRWWDNSSMRDNYPNPKLWSRVVPLYVNQVSFRRQLRIPSGHQVVILLTDHEGNVLWRTSGPVTAKKLSLLRTHLH